MIGHIPSYVGCSKPSSRGVEEIDGRVDLIDQRDGELKCQRERMKTSPASFRKWVAPLGLAIVLIGTGCRTTQRVVHLSRPHQEILPHTVERLDAAYVTPEGRLHVRALGRLAGEAQLRELTIQVAQPLSPKTKLADRVGVAADSVRAGWTPPSEAARAITVGAPIVFLENESYDWWRLLAKSGEVERVHLVRRENSAVSWEILHVNAQSKVAFRIYEMQPASVTVKRPTYALLVPFAAATDVLNGTAATVAPTVATAGLAAMCLHPYAGPPYWAYFGEHGSELVHNLYGPLRETLRSPTPESASSK